MIHLEGCTCGGIENTRQGGRAHQVFTDIGHDYWCAAVNNISLAREIARLQNELDQDRAKRTLTEVDRNSILGFTELIKNYDNPCLHEVASILRRMAITSTGAEQAGTVAAPAKEGKYKPEKLYFRGEWYVESGKFKWFEQLDSKDKFGTVAVECVSGPIIEVILPPPNEPEPLPEITQRWTCRGCNSSSSLGDNKIVHDLSCPHSKKGNL